MSGRDPTYVGECEIIAETDDAILAKDDEGEVWIPKSVLHEENEINEIGDIGELVVFEWFAEEKGL